MAKIRKRDAGFRLEEFLLLLSLLLFLWLKDFRVQVSSRKLDPIAIADWYLCVKVKVQDENIFNIDKSALRSEQELTSINSIMRAPSYTQFPTRG
ncbi:hypothetical protein [Prolixibacter bellariivorans]|uniref:hypothetical protein n=1 Tax=Prolixibacter bellariivorans TaxID=314319 RepID=UPI001F353832|nr:hypothetical protein [Prolixibacter bellariivorans]